MAEKYLYNNAGRPTERELKTSSAGAADAGKGVALDASGKLDITMMPAGVGASTVTAPASEALAAGAFVNLWNDSGTLKARNADATTNGKKANGFVLSAVSNGASATVYLGGVNTSVTGKTLGAPQFLSTTPGASTETAPSAAGNLVQQLGEAVAATTIRFSPQEIATLA